MVYNVTCNTIGAVPNAPLASSTGKELYPPILIWIVIHRIKVIREKISEVFKMVIHMMESFFYVDDSRIASS